MKITRNHKTLTEEFYIPRVTHIAWVIQPRAIGPHLGIPDFIVHSNNNFQTSIESAIRKDHIVRKYLNRAAGYFSGNDVLKGSNG